MSLISAENRFGAFRHSSYRRFFTARFFAAFAFQIVSVSVGWQMYEVTGNAFYLGLIGLFQFLPSLLLILVTGTVADRHNRRLIMAIGFIVAAVCAAALLGLTLTHTFAPWPVFAILVVIGIERAFMGPAVQSLGPNLVPVEDLPNAVAWNSSSWQMASILGPVVGGLLYGVGASLAYGVAFSLFALAAILAFIIRKPEQRSPAKAVSLESMLAGFRFIAQEKVVLGAISLDLFAVLLGGAVALMPIFAKEVLTLGPWGLGLLRAAPGIGAIVVAVILAFKPIRHHAGLLMFVGVGLFGVSTVVFGLSETAWLSIAALVVMGASDMVSVYVRETLIALWTPDEVRGRVNAVNSVFVGASNELGEFRAGTMAHVFGAVPAVVIGGAGTLAVAVIWALGFSKLRKIDSLDLPKD
ncbi:MFS transporter [Rhizobium sp. RM]|uniref:MFS transporter n=1 Tax=Rhizobium/Agrobacterium group TaxID=227290 RepID=UPI00110E68FC|nr:MULTISPECIES: MFS transporter [Rhizobium/Agrobacterium group]NWJ23307.1 MFS transporter [Rhizobium sp. RM]TMV14179.1 MFS transporter [Rhizobium sp. Td3]UXS02525.1 MFS transporter [Agrobacterium tumefaciens]